MMKQIKRMMIFITVLMTGLTIQCQQNEQNAKANHLYRNAAYSSFASNIATKMIDGMQGALHLNRLAQQHLVISASQEITDSLMIQINESKSLFTRLLDEYLENLGQVYEKKAGLFGGYRKSYYISSKIDQSLTITPNQYAALIQTLQDAAQQSDWGKTINITFAVMHENNSIIERDLTLNEIIAALKHVPLPAGYSTAAIVGGVAATTAVGAGAYYAYNNMDDLKNAVSNIEGYFGQ